MSLEFQLSIRLGNSSMRTTADIVKALRDVADRAERTLDSEPEDSEAPRNILDANGNSVGHWCIAEIDPES